MYPLTLLSFATAVLSVTASSNHQVRDSHRHRKAAARRSAGLPTNWTLQSDCVTDAAEPNRLLSSHSYSHKLTPTSCIAQCESEGASYAGLEWGGECHCGSTLHKTDKIGVAVQSTVCSIPCNGDSVLVCGGNWHLTIYAKLNGTSPTPAHSASATKSASAIVTKSTAAAATTSAVVANSQYKLKDTFQGSSFFDGFVFFNDKDPTNGLVNYQTKDEATKQGLAYVQDDGTAVIKVDSTSWVAAGQNRNSVRISTKNTYDSGLFVYDISEMPVGCSVWPAAWAVGTGATWPEGGEIDIIEGVNNSTMNQMTVHTGTQTTCNINSINPDSLLKTSSFLGKTCASSDGNNQGCAVQESDPTSYGVGFNAIGGGVYAVLVNDDGTKIWRFPRNAAIPADITAQKPNPSAWGLPTAIFPSSDSCKTQDAFKKLSLVFDITLCGDWCNSSYTSSGCPGTCADRILDPNNFKTASWKVKSVLVYQ